VYLYAIRRDASIWDFRISITTESIKFYVGSTDSLVLNYIIKVFLFFLCMPCEQRYCNVKSDLENFTLRNIIVIIVVDFVRFQFPSRQALAIKPTSLPISDRGISLQRVDVMTRTQRRIRVRVHSTIWLASNGRRAPTICCLFLPYTKATATLFRNS